MHYGYDIEVLPNFASFVFERVEDGSIWEYQLSPWRNDTQELLTFLTSVRLSNGRMIGFNNLGYDYPMLHFIMESQGHVNNSTLYEKSRAIVTADFNDRSHRIWDNQILIPQIDLRAIHHFDNKAKLTSLKLLEFNMRMKSIVELGISFTENISVTDVPAIMSYNRHDVKATLLFYQQSIEAIKFRDELSAKHEWDFTNFNDIKIGETIFTIELEKNGVNVSRYNQTIRHEIRVADILLPKLKFETVQFRSVLDFFKGTIINPDKIKGFFGSRDKAKSKCEVDIDMPLALSMNPKDVTVNYTDGTKSTMENLDTGKTITTLRPVNIHCVVDGFRYDFGAGGIHGSMIDTKVVPVQGQTLRDSDVKSYYPKVSIGNRLRPAHLGETFCDVYEDLYNERLKHKKGTSTNGSIKLALVGITGKANDKYSAFFDPQYNMAITINGQLLLCMLVEQLRKVEGFEIVQVNTDGLTYLFNTDKAEEIDKTMTEWENVTSLELEHVKYKMMTVCNVNNYLAVTEDDKVKRIGTFAYETPVDNPGTRELPWHKNHSSIVVAKALEAVLVRGEDAETFMREHIKTDPLDFMRRTKVNRNDELALETPATMWGDSEVLPAVTESCQNVSRYFVSNRGGYLFKIMAPTALQVESWNSKPHWRHKVTGVYKVSKKAPSGMYIQCKPETPEPPMRRIGIDAGYKVTVCNDVTNLDLSDLNFDYYVKQVEKITGKLSRHCSKGRYTV